MHKINVINGKYRSTLISNQIFKVKSIEPAVINNAMYFLVLDEELGRFKRIEVFEYDIIENDSNNVNKEVINTPKLKTIEELESEIKEKFEVMENLYTAVVSGSSRALILSGSAGTGKSSSIMTMLEKQAKLVGTEYTVIKGYTTPKYIFQTLQTCSKQGHIVVFDDIDQVFLDHNSLNILKAATESGNKPRIIRWGTSVGLEEEKSFEFRGSIIFLTNISFNKMTKNAVLLEHLKALASRSLYFDVSLESNIEVFIRIKLVSKQILSSYNLTDTEQKEILDFIHENLDSFFELSLRTVPKIAELYKFDIVNWKRLVKATMFKNKYNSF